MSRGSDVADKKYVKNFSGETKCKSAWKTVTET
jgi:hypothetical protein